MRHFALKDSSNPGRPALLFETDIDFHDVRSGTAVADHAFFAAVWLQGGDDLSWTQDMVRRLSSDQLTLIEPPWQLEWPESADHQFLDHLLSSYRVMIWKNSVLGIYSQGGETREEFEERCRESLRELRFQELKQLREIFLHRFFELEKRATEQTESQDWDVKLEAQGRAQVVALFSRIREDLSRWFVNDSHQILPLSQADWSLASFPDIEERVLELKHDLTSACNRVSSRYEEEARSIEPYSVRLASSAVRIVSRNILWE